MSLTDTTKEVRRGQVWAPIKGPGGNVRVMNVVDGYVMYRIPTGFPLVHGAGDFVRHFRRVE